MTIEGGPMSDDLDDLRAFAAKMPEDYGPMFGRDVTRLVDELRVARAVLSRYEARDKLIEDFCEAHLPFASEKSEVVARRVLWALRGSNEDPPSPEARAALGAQA